MSKIIYYIGAGASYGNREARHITKDSKGNDILDIQEGLPLVNEIPSSLLAFKKSIENTDIDENEVYNLGGINISGEDLSLVKKYMVSDIEKLYEQTIVHSTIDTYARKLTLIRNFSELKRLKNMLCLYFMWLQLSGKSDQRYDTFLANVLTMDRLYLPSEISIISWNYDSQLEMAYRFYTHNGTLPVYEKNTESEWGRISSDGKIIKINGSATIGDFNAVIHLLNTQNGIPFNIRLINIYGDLGADTSQLGFQFKSHLSFAWEYGQSTNKIVSLAQSTVADAESVIVIGYSFPFFNREVDRTIFAAMPNLKTVYIQSPKPENIRPSLEAVLPLDYRPEIVNIDDCSQFYLPREL